MRFAGLITLMVFATMVMTTCGGGSDYSGKVEKSGAASPQDPFRGDAPPAGTGPAAIEVRYTEQLNGEMSRDILLKADATFIISVHGYASRDAKEKITQRWDTKLKEVQTQAIMEGCSYEIMSGLKVALPSTTLEGGIATIVVRFANGEETTVQASNKTTPPNDFRAIAHTLTELAKEKVMDKSIIPVDVPA